MPDKSHTREQTGEIPKQPIDTIAHLQAAGLGNLMGMGTAWAEAVGDMGAELVSFVVERIKEDVKTQHQILHCKNVKELQHIQAEFVQKALDQYQAETGKLVEMGTKVFSRTADGKDA